MNGFTIYKEYYELITLLTEKEQQEILLAITKYMFEDIEPVLNDKQTKIFNNLRRPLEKSKKKSKSGSTNKSKENQNKNKKVTKQNQNEIKIKSNNNQNENETKTHQDVNVIVNVNDNVDVNNLEELGYGEEKPLKKIIDYLNQKSNSKFKYSSKATQTKINARLNEGYTLDDFIDVIDKKCEEWIGTEFEKYLSPETLFGTKFEKYLNQKMSKVAKKTKSDEQWEILKGVYDGTIKID